MKTLVLDTTELLRDLRLDGLAAQLLSFAISADQVRVCIPVVVVEEMIAHHRRQVEEANGDAEKLKAKWRRLGLGDLTIPAVELDYREYIRSRFDFALGFRTLPWPQATHSHLVSRATNRVPPFDEKGGGYRSLVWFSALELAAAGADVVLVSADRAFSGRDDKLSDALAAEAADTPGSIELAHDLTKWLVGNLAWRAQTLDALLQEARDQEVNRMLQDWDMRDSLEPSIEDLDLGHWPFEYDLLAVDWADAATLISSRSGPGGVYMGECDIAAVAHFEAEFPEGVALEPHWEAIRPAFGARVEVRGSVELIARIAVLFDDDAHGYFQDLSWRRSGFLPPFAPGPSSYDTPMFDLDELTG